MSDSIFNPRCHQVFKCNVKIPLSFVFPRLNTPRSFSPSLCVRCFKILVIFLVLCQTCSRILFLTESQIASSTGCSSADVSDCRCFSPGLSKPKGQGKFISLNTDSCSSGGCQPFLLQGHIAGSWSVCWQPWLPGPPLPRCFSADWPQPVLVLGIVLPLMYFPLLNLMRFLHVTSGGSSECQHTALMNLTLLRLLYHLQTCWGCSLSQHPGDQWRC